MKAYPVRIAPDSYRGRDERKVAKRSEYNRVAARVEKHINDKLRDAPDNSIHQFLSAYIAINLREDSDLVHRIVFSIDCGHNGATIFKGDYALAMKAVTDPQGVI